ncbi:hypothetical protein CQW32_04945 [Pseudomonas putida]|jgi:hypothetical protein|uniref:hypothetical protein n=1 Tax=Pseudomonas TaxID=286 RepID=UPI000C2AC658|nr:MULTISPECIES: hypothetical protein [Pseudomonas]PJX11569.1 hypothetical protein CQW32_04945 [Pseudomonas putida]
MGMDVLGQAPFSERGEYFRNNVWWWHPLWEYCERLAPDLIPSDNLGHYNDGWGLDGPASLELANRLAAALQSGQVEQYAQDYAGFLAALPDEPCTTCAAPGRIPTPALCRATAAKALAADRTSRRTTRSRPRTYASSKYSFGIAEDSAFVECLTI